LPVPLNSGEAYVDRQECLSYKVEKSLVAERFMRGWRVCRGIE
jgi:hypothetical protein